MKKSRAAYYYILFSGAVPALTAAFLPAISALLISAAAVFCLWWTLFYRSIRYTVVSEALTIRSGVLLKKLRSVPLENIQWVMRLKPPFCRGAAVSVLHTASGAVVIFGDFSTKS